MPLSRRPRTPPIDYDRYGPRSSRDTSDAHGRKSL